MTLNRWHTAASIYAQKSLSYLIVLVTFLFIQFTIFSFVDKIDNCLSRILFLVFVTLSFFVISTYSILLCRTSFELYAIEVKIGTIGGWNLTDSDGGDIFELTKSELEKHKSRLIRLIRWFYNCKIANWFFRPEKRRIIDSLFLAMIVLIIIDAVLCTLIMLKIWCVY